MNNLIAVVLLSACIVSIAEAQQQPLSGSLRADLSATLGAQADATAQPMLLDEAPAGKKKSAALAALFSLILPGMGETYAEGLDAGKYPLIAEGALWLTYGSMQYYGGWLRDDARRFAAAHAGIASVDMTDQFFVDVSNFQDTYAYNEKKLRDRNASALYTSPQYAWSWDSDANRSQFREQRVSSERVFNNSRFVIGGMLVNRIISAINAVRFTRRHNRSIQSGEAGETGLGAWRLESSWLGQMDGVQVSLVRNF